MADNGWDSSASAWIESIGQYGDFARAYVLDAPMLARVHGRGFHTALDVGCGEGRFCRMLREQGLDVLGAEPTDKLLQEAKARDPVGGYLKAVAEDLPFEDDSFDLVVSYLTLIDIDDIETAITEMTRVLRPGGSLLIANLNSFNTSGGWVRSAGSEPVFQIDNYLQERSEWVNWGGVSIRNWHRPFSSYMQLLLANNLQLVYFDEPVPTGGDPAKADRYRRCPYFHIMEWQAAKRG